jgi:hypothetical protein
MEGKDQMRPFNTYLEALYGIAKQFQETSYIRLKEGINTLNSCLKLSNYLIIVFRQRSANLSSGEGKAETTTDCPTVYISIVDDRYIYNNHLSFTQLSTKTDPTFPSIFLPPLPKQFQKMWSIL